MHTEREEVTFADYHITISIWESSALCDIMMSRFLFLHSMRLTTVPTE